MDIGTVNASSLNLRVEPNGTIVKALPFGASLEISEQKAGWLEVAAGADRGWVAAQFVTRHASDAPSAEDLPPADSGQIHDDGRSAYSPDGVAFAAKVAGGWVARGKTSAPSFITGNAAGFGSGMDSLLRVIRVVSGNEGTLEAVNAYDNSFLSFGILQWTAGAGADGGELAGLLLRLKNDAPDRFAAFFGDYGLQPESMRNSAGLLTGYLGLQGKTLATPSDKECLRNALWVYRFWRAGHDSAVRTCQVKHALSRINGFYGSPLGLPKGQRVADYVNSEVGLALLLDEHVNRPGHVPKTLAAAVASYVETRGRDDPAAWTSVEEAALLDVYVAQRATTNMTHSTARADAIRRSAVVSLERGSFQMPDTSII